MLNIKMLNIKMSVSVPAVSVIQGSDSMDVETETETDTEPIEVENILDNFDGINGPMSLTIHYKIKKEDLGNETDEELVYVFGEYHGLENNCSSKYTNSIDIDELFKLEIENSKDKINFYMEDDFSITTTDKIIYINRVRSLLREKEAQQVINNHKFDFRLGLQFPETYQDIMGIILNDYSNIDRLYHIIKGNIIDNNGVMVSSLYINKTKFDQENSIKNINHLISKYINSQFANNLYIVSGNEIYVNVDEKEIINRIKEKMIEIFYFENLLIEYINNLFEIQILKESLPKINESGNETIKNDVKANFLVKRLILKNKMDGDIYIQKLNKIMSILKNLLLGTPQNININTQFIDIDNKIKFLEDEIFFLYENQQYALSTFLSVTHDFDSSFLEVRFNKEFKDVFSRIVIVKNLVISYFDQFLIPEQKDFLLNFTITNDELYDYFLNNNDNYKALYTFIMAGTAFLTDYVAIANLFNNNYESRNSIIYAGNAHAEHFRKILELGGYIEIESFGERKLYEGKDFALDSKENQSRCLDVSHLQFPFFKKDILNSLIDAKIKELKQI